MQGQDIGLALGAVVTTTATAVVLTSTPSGLAPDAAGPVLPLAPQRGQVAGPSTVGRVPDRSVSSDAGQRSLAVSDLVQPNAAAQAGRTGAAAQAGRTFAAAQAGQSGSG